MTRLSLPPVFLLLTTFGVQQLLSTVLLPLPHSQVLTHILYPTPFSTIFLLSV